MRIALGQLAASGRKEENLDAARQAVHAARHGGADLLLLPEVFMAFLTPRSGTVPAAVAEPLDGPFVSALADAARGSRLYVGCGVWETAPGEGIRAYNTAVLLGPDGSLLLSYRKTHMYDAFAFRESDLAVAGDAAPRAVRTPIGVLGMLVCYELRFPELARMLALDGAEVLLLPSAWIAGPLKETHWTTLIGARAIENTIFVAAADQAGDGRVGRSRLVDPMGIALASGGEAPGVIFGDVDLARIGQVRQKLPALSQRREEIYAQRAPVGRTASRR
ncbi:MAG TPA: carbon-nitrogen hydrolase family protein [bacterium]|nr:carbon-nitrogen hydrolase family protein [bacterium]